MCIDGGRRARTKPSWGVSPRRHALYENFANKTVRWWWWWWCRFVVILGRRILIVARTHTTVKTTRNGDNGTIHTWNWSWGRKRLLYTDEFRDRPRGKREKKKKEKHR